MVVYWLWKFLIQSHCQTSASEQAGEAETEQFIVKVDRSRDYVINFFDAKFTLEC